MESTTAVQVAKGLATYVVPRRHFNRAPEEPASARYCYSVFLRHLVRVHRATGRVPLGNVAELGPGGSLGTGIAALIAGADSYFALDIRRDSDRAWNLRIFDELVQLFISKEPIPQEFPEVRPRLESGRFPEQILTDEHLARTLAPDRLAAIRAEVERDVFDKESVISYRAPWFADEHLPRETIDWVLSQAVLEHVDDLLSTYDAAHTMMRPEGVMSHQIDFRSHGTAAEWDGHRGYSPLLWRVIRGRRDYLINRQPASAHLTAAEAAGFHLLAAETERLPTTRERATLAKQFQGWSEDDLAASSGFFVHQRTSPPTAGSSQ